MCGICVQSLVPTRWTSRLAGGREDSIFEGGREECVGFASRVSCHPGGHPGSWVGGRIFHPGLGTTKRPLPLPRLSDYMLLSGYAGPAPYIPHSPPPLCRPSASWRNTAARASSPLRWPRWGASRRRWPGGALRGKRVGEGSERGDGPKKCVDEGMRGDI